jgi:hypothetical protein
VNSSRKGSRSTGSSSSCSASTGASSKGRVRSAIVWRAAGQTVSWVWTSAAAFVQGVRLPWGGTQPAPNTGSILVQRNHNTTHVPGWQHVRHDGQGLDRTSCRSAPTRGRGGGGAGQ